MLGLDEVKLWNELSEYRDVLVRPARTFD